MSTEGRCVVSVGVGERFLPYLGRLVRTFRNAGKYADSILCWADSWPPHSPTHGEMHYAFKFYAVAEAKRRGFRYVTYLDSSCWAAEPVEPYWEALVKEGYFLAYDDDVLGKWISDGALEHFGMSRDEAMTMALPAGAIVGLDFENEKAKAFFEEWGRLSRTGLFFACHSEHAPDRMRSLMVSDNPVGKEIISEDPRCLGHRSDEACFGPLMKKLGMNLTKVGRLFGGGVWGGGIIRCGYDTGGIL